MRGVEEKFQLFQQLLSVFLLYVVVFFCVSNDAVQSKSVREREQSVSRFVIVTFPVALVLLKDLIHYGGSIS